MDAIDFSKRLLTNYEHMWVSNCAQSTNMLSIYVNFKTKAYRNDASSYINQKAPILSKEMIVKEAGGNGIIGKYVKQNNYENSFKNLL